MKKNLFFAVAIMATMLFTSCIQVCHDPYNPLDRPGRVAFTGTVDGMTTRITDGAGTTTWSGDEEIGIFAISPGNQNLPLITGNIFEGASNIMFYTPASGTVGNFIIGNSAQAIYFPVTGVLDFIAYHPFNATLVNNFFLPVNVTDQTDLVALDFLWARVNNRVNTTPTVPLEFQRRMSQVELNITAGENITTFSTAPVITITGAYAISQMNLADGSIAIGNTATVAPIPTVVALNSTDNVASSRSILIPQNFTAVRIEYDGEVWTWTPSTTLTMAARDRHIINLTIRRDPTFGSTMVIEDGVTITYWNNVPTTDNTPISPDVQFVVDTDEVAVAAVVGAATTSEIVLTAANTQDWTITGVPTWLTINETTGQGTKTLTFTAAEENTGAYREATILITPDNPTDFLPIPITVTQAAAPTVTTGLLFPGANFADWNAFLGAPTTNFPTPPTPPYEHRPVVISQSVLGGKNQTSAMSIYGQVPHEGFATLTLFSTTFPAGTLDAANYVHFYINGTSNGRSIAATFSVTNLTTRAAFNLGAVGTTDMVIESVGTQLLTGTVTNPSPINTGGEWTRITLDLSTISATYRTTANRFQLRAGAWTSTTPGIWATYDLRIANITIE